MTDSIFQALAARIDAAWFEANYRDASFPEICVQALEQTSPAASCGPMPPSCGLSHGNVSNRWSSGCTNFHDCLLH